MLFHSVKLMNYKSIGENNSELIIEPRLTAIIGKNESGKSNVLSGLSNISFTNVMNFIKDDINRNTISENAKIQYKIVLKPTSDESKKIKNDTIICITKDKYEVSGGIFDYYKLNIYPIFLKLCETLGSNPFKLRDTEFNTYSTYINLLKNENTLNIPKIQLALKFINSHIPSISQEKKDTIEHIISTVMKEWNILLNMLPSVFYRKSDKTLKSQYKYDEIKKELSNPSLYPNSLLSDFLQLIDISKEDFLIAAQAGAISGQKNTIRHRIKRNINTYINIPFSSFYDVEKISLSIDFDANIVYFSVQSSDSESLLLHERSGGLKWYLNTFIDAKAHEIANSNVLYLLDEPGIFLHINAQKELLHFFNQLADLGNQVIYTTHSPYMLNTTSEGVHKIRAVVKDQNGNTSIYKTAYDSRISPINQKDTLTPIINALGMNLYDTIGPSKDKLNIVSEGMSDYIFLNTMAEVLNIDKEKYVIIPSFGASNCVNICSILHGWGCKYIALFDYDKAGVESGGEIMRNKMNLNLNEHFCYVKDITIEEIINKTYKVDTFVIEDLVSQSEIDRFYKEFNYANFDKTLTAKIMSNEILSGKFIISEECKNNFRKLFDRILK